MQGLLTGVCRALCLNRAIQIVSIPSPKHREHRSREQRLSSWAMGGVLRNAVFWTWRGHFTHEAMAAVVICLRPAWDEASRNSSMVEGLTRPTLAEELWATDGFKERKIHFLHMCGL